MVEMILYPNGIKNKIEYNKALNTLTLLMNGENEFEIFYLQYLAELIEIYEDEIPIMKVVK